MDGYSGANKLTAQAQVRCPFLLFFGGGMLNSLETHETKGFVVTQEGVSKRSRSSMDVDGGH